MSSKYSEIGPWTTELAALEGLKKNPIFSAIFHLILFILAGNEDMHKSWDEFEIRPDPTTGFHGNR